MLASGKVGRPPDLLLADREATDQGEGHKAVERTPAWLSRYRRLSVRYERRADIHGAFLHLGCSLICLNYLK